VSSSDLESVYRSALALTSHERAELVERILLTLDSEAIDRAWGDEAEERIRAYEAGELSARDGDDVSGDIKKRL
jgi:putative addiction module component (TIGR02574 family)